MYNTVLYLLVLTCFILHFGNCAETTCADSQKHFANLCFSPTDFADLDWKWADANQPSSGWYRIMGNDVERLHFASGLKGQLLSSTDNFDDICLRTKVFNPTKEKPSVDGHYFGFSNLSTDWTCKVSADNPGLLLCDDYNPMTKYHENYNYYVPYSDNKSVVLTIGCFPNGQVGWSTLSVNDTLTDDEKKIIEDKITSLGFSAENTVTLYDKDKCSGGK